MTRILQDLDVFSFGDPLPMASMALIYKMTLDCVVGRGGTVNAQLVATKHSLCWLLQVNQDLARSSIFILDLLTTSI